MPRDACPTCDGPLASGRCLRRENQSSSRFVHREIVVLAVLVGIAVAAAFVTRRFAASNEALRLQDGRAWLVGTRDDLIGLLRPERVMEAIQAGRGSGTIGTLIDVSFHHAHSDHLVDIVLERLADGEGVLPIVSRDDIRRVEGVITPDDVVRVLGRRQSA